MKEKINKYLVGDLEGETLEQFEMLLANDKQFKAEVDRKNQLLEDSIHEGVLYYYELENMIRNIHQKVQAEKKKTNTTKTIIQQLVPRRNFTKWWIVAATIALFVILYFLMPKNPSQKQIITQWEKTIPTELSLKDMGIGLSSTSTIEEKKATVENAFAQKNYQKAKNICNQILQDTIIEKIRLGRGLCELYLERYAAAIQDFETVENSNAIFKTQATWLKGLAYLKNGEIDKSINVMENLVDNQSASSIERANAQQLLEQLRQLK